MFLKNYLLSTLFLLVLGSLSAQNWSNEGFAPGHAVAYDQDNNERWVITTNNIYKSNDNGASWTQQLSEVNAPFMAPSQTSVNYPIFDSNRTRVFGDFMLLGVRTSFSDYETWISVNGGLFLYQFDLQDELFVEAYELENGIIVIQTRIYDNTSSDFYRSKWYRGILGGDSFITFYNGFEGSARIVGETNSQFVIHDNDQLHYFDLGTYSENGSVTLPTEAITAQVNGNVIRAVDYDPADNSNPSLLTLHRSTDGGTSFSTETMSLAVNNFKQTQIIGDYIYTNTGNFSFASSVPYRYDLNDFQNPQALSNGSIYSSYFPLKQTTDGILVNKFQGPYPHYPNIFAHGDVNAFNTPFLKSNDNWNTTQSVEKVEYAFKGMVDYGGYYGRLVGSNAYTTTDGKDFEARDDFFGSVLKGDKGFLNSSQYISVYADPSTTSYFSNDGINFQTGTQLGLNNNRIDYYQAGSDIIARTNSGSFGTPLYRSQDNGDNWEELIVSYLWRYRMFADVKNGTLYGVNGDYNVDETYSMSIAKSMDNGSTWRMLDTNLPVLESDEFSGRQGRPLTAWNNHLFAKKADGLYHSADGGTTFNLVNFPGIMNGACVNINGDEFIVTTSDEKIYTVDLIEWLGNSPAPTQAGYQVDLEVDISLEPENPAPWSNFDIVVSVTNNSDVPASRIAMRTPFVSGADATPQGGVAPNYSANFDWANPSSNVLAPGETATARFPWFRLDGGEITTSSYVESQFEPDVDSQPGTPAEGYPEDDEARWPNNNTSVLTIDCPADMLIPTTGGQTGPLGINYDPPTATTTCPNGNVIVQLIDGPASGSVGILNTPYEITYLITDDCGNSETCTFTIEYYTLIQTTVNCPDDIYKEEVHPFPSPGGQFTGFGDAKLIFPTASGTCAFPTADVQYIGTAPTFMIGNDLWIDGPGEFEAVFQVSVCGVVDTCSYNVEIVVPPLINEFTFCPEDITVTVPTGTTSTTVDYDTPIFEFNCPGSLVQLGTAADTESGDDFQLGTTTVTWIAETTLCAQVECSFDVTVIEQSGNSGVDLSLNVFSNDNIIDAYETTTAQIILTNSGTETANDLIVDVEIPEGTVLVGADPYSTDTGTFQPFGDTQWNVGSLDAGSSAQLFINLFTLTDGELFLYAEVLTQSPGEMDSSPGNGTPPLINEDDEAGYTWNGSGAACQAPTFTDLVTTDSSVIVSWTAEIEEGGYIFRVNQLNDPFSVDQPLPTGTTSFEMVYPFTPGETYRFTIQTVCATVPFPVTSIFSDPVDYTVPISQLPDIFIGELTPTSTTTVTAGSGIGFNVPFENGGGEFDPADFPFYSELYISSDQTPSADDLILDDLLLSGIGDALMGGTIPAITPPGIYYAIAVADLENDIEESNEENNVSPVLEIEVLEPNNSNLIDLELSMTQNVEQPDQWDYYSVMVTLTNNGTIAATGASVNIPLDKNIKVYVGGNEYAASVGSFNTFTNNWYLPTLPAGSSETLTLNYFTLAADVPATWGQVVGVLENDVDSSPNNGVAPFVNEDDEASTGAPILGMQADLNMTVNVNPTTVTTSSPAGPIISFNSTNMGNVASGPFQITIFLSDDDQWDAADTQLTTYSIIGGVQPMQAVSAGGNQTLDLTAGTYYIIGFADNLGQVDEADESNNIDVVEITVINDNDFPDLTASNLQIPDYLNLGEAAPFSFDLINLGNATAEGDYVINAYLSLDTYWDSSDIFAGEVLTGNTPVGTTPNVQSSLYVDNITTGDWRIILVVDANNDIAESNEYNNQISRFLPVNNNSGGTSDFIISASLNPTVVLQGASGQTEVTFTVTNQGTGAYAAFPRTDVFLSDDNVLDANDELFTLYSLPYLEPGASRTETFLAEFDVNVGTYYLIFSTDHTNQIAESNENNNVAVASFTVVDDPSLCEILDADITYYCVDNNTPFDDSDDLMTVLVKAVAFNYGDSYSVSGDLNTLNDLSYGGSNLLAHNVPFPSDGSVELFIADNTYPDCATTVIMENPATCSNGNDPLPDLAIDVNVIHLSNPQKLYANITLKRMNDVVFGPGTVKMFLSTDATLSSDDIFIAERNHLKAPDFYPGIPMEFAGDVPAGLPGGDYYAFVVADANEVIAETDETNNTVFRIVTIEGSPEGPDLELSASLPNPSPDQYSNYSILYTLKNSGTETMNNIEVLAATPDGVVLVGNDPFSSTQGSFNTYSNIWALDHLAPGEQAMLSINYFLLQTGNQDHFAQVWAHTETDVDSNPGNASCCVTNEDDEVYIQTLPSQNRLSANAFAGDHFQILNIYPNPTEGDQLFIQINAPKEQEKLIYLYDGLGQEIARNWFGLHKGINKIELNLSHLPAGQYRIMIQEERMKHMPSTFIIAK